MTPEIIYRAAFSPVSWSIQLIARKGQKEGASMATELTAGAKAPHFKLPRGGGRTRLHARIDRFFTTATAI
jgi:hypothetical protein